MRLTTTSCPNIGLLLDCLATGYQRDLIEGSLRAASQRGANLWIFVGRWFIDEHLTDPDNVVYRFAKRPVIDGVVGAMSTLVNQLGAEQGERILRGLGLPAVSLGLLLPDLPSVGVDNPGGATLVCEHLARDHGYRRFAMIAGPPQNTESEQRIAACRQTLAAFDVDLPEERIARKNFWIQSGVDGVQELFGTRQLSVDSIDALICASDLIAEGAVRALAKRGVRTPEQIAVTGFDDIDRAKYVSPPLTTIHQPLVDMALTATRSLLQALDGGDVPQRQIVPPKLVLRNSCGCVPSPPTASKATAAGLEAARGRASSRLLERRDLISASLARAARGQFKAAGSGWESRWIMSLLADLTTPDETAFLTQLGTTLRSMTRGRAELEVCLDVLASFREEALLGVQDVPSCRRIEDIMHAARLMTMSALERLEVNRRLVTSEALYGATFALERLMRLVGQPAFWERLEQELRLLGVHTCFVTRYVGSGYERASCFWQFSDREPAAASLNGQTFPSEQLLPAKLCSRRREYGMIVRPLVFGGRALGTAVISLGAADIAVYEPLFALMALALDRA